MKNFKIVHNNKSFEFTWENESKFYDLLFYQRTPWNKDNYSGAMDILNLIYSDFMGVFPGNIQSLKNVMDIGCGMSIIDLYLSKINPNINFYLVDKNEISDFSDYTYIYKNKYYHMNQWDAVEDGIINSGLELNKFHFREPVSEFPKNLDLIISTASWCWHYSKDDYWDRAYNSLRVGGYLVLQILFRKDRDYVEEISDALKSKPNYTLFPIERFSHMISFEWKRDNFFTMTEKYNYSPGGIFCWIKN